MQWNNRGKISRRHAIKISTTRKLGQNFKLKFQELSRTQVENKIEIEITAKEKKKKKGNVIRTFEMCKYILEKF